MQSVRWSLTFGSTRTEEALLIRFLNLLRPALEIGRAQPPAAVAARVQGDACKMHPYCVDRGSRIDVMNNISKIMDCAGPKGTDAAPHPKKRYNSRRSILCN